MLLLCDSQWTKGFNAKGCVGEDVVELLQTELDERSIKARKPFRDACARARSRLCCARLAWEPPF